ncbi:uncharacterized protein [Setaria viridis]|uniref:uncharacterized protein n=1 Tax=Setaria viridis TaxID=4556 RepID=UPI0014939AF3|nr:uncharacterized protein LOC117854789 [Setaria viridis]
MSSAASTAHTSQSTSKKDPAWEHALPLTGKEIKNQVGCKYCKNYFNGGITRFKKHLAGVKGQSISCKQVPENVKEKIKAMLDAHDEKKSAKLDCQLRMRQQVNINENDEEDCVVMEGGGEIEDQAGSSSALVPKQPKIKGPMDSYCMRPEQARAKGKHLQTTMSQHYKVKEREKAHEYIADWFYQAAIPHNTVLLDSFDLMLEAIGQFGPGLKKPSPYQLGTPLLNKHVNLVHEFLEVQKEQWSLTGCSIMTDAWTDRRGRSLMNLVAHCSRGVCFLEAIDASMEVHDGKYIYSLVSSCIDDIGPEKIVQVVTDNASNNIAASKLLKLKYPHIFWTACAAHSIDLMLEDISKISMVHNIIRDAKAITNLLYAHTRLLAIMRQYTKVDLVRAGTTRFATSYLNLRSLYDKRNELKQLFASQEWDKSSWSKKISGQNAHDLVLNNKFWSQMLEVINYFEPLAYVLRRVDGDVPAMGYIYGDILKAKQDIAVRLNGNEKKYGPIWGIIDARWDSKLKTPLHKAGYFLNPGFFYDNKKEMEDEVLMEAVVQCAAQMYRDDITMQDNIVSQLTMYTEATGSFGTPMAIRQRNIPTISPANWWSVHGGSAKDLRKMAIRILSLTCSSSACERTWSAFERVHSKKRTRLGQRKLNALVFVMFNKRLQWKYSQKDRDPLVAKFIDDESTNEWIVDPDAPAPQLEDDAQSGSVRGKRRLIHKSSSSKAKKARVVAEDEQEEFDSSESEEEEEGNIPYADGDGSNDHEADDVASDNE